MTFLVTVKLPRRADHDPFNKVTGPCPVSGKDCSDVTGMHHSTLVQADSIESVRKIFEDWRITRIEDV